MIYGVGCDIVEVARVRKVFNSDRTLRRCFSDREVALLEGRPERIAGNFAAKEALAKALGIGFRGFSLRDVEVLRDELGRPFVSRDSWAGISAKVGVSEALKIHLSISHERNYAMAVCMLEKS